MQKDNEIRMENLRLGKGGEYLGTSGDVVGRQIKMTVPPSSTCQNENVIMCNNWGGNILSNQEN